MKFSLLCFGLELQRMGRQCSVVSCRKSKGLHGFPNSELLRRQWSRACGYDENTEHYCEGVCDEHFTQDAYSNWYEVEMGFSKKLRLHPYAVPTLALPRFQLPRGRLPPLLPQRISTPPGQRPALCRLEPKGKVDVGCQTDRVLTMNAFVQANRRPPYRSTGIQARAPSRSVLCDTQGLIESPDKSCSIERSSKRTREDSDSDSSFISNEDENISNTSKGLSHFIVDEDKLMALFVRCSICSSTCDVTKTTTRTLLCIKQRCGFCDTSNEWFSHG